MSVSRRPRLPSALTTVSTYVLTLLVVVGVTSGHPALALEQPPTPTVLELPGDWPGPPPIDAEAFVLVEAATGQVLAGQRSAERRPVASTIKILTALSAMERVELDTEVTAGDEVLGIGGASVGLEPGDTWTVEQLLVAVLARSGNEASHTLATHVAGSTDAFIDLMREDLAAIGLPGIALDDVSGLDDSNLLSAEDLATLTRVAMEVEDFRRIVGQPIVSLPGVGAVESRNRLLDTYPDATGVKTGFTLAAGNSLVASARRGERELIAVVLGSGEDPARFDAAATLLDLGFDRYQPTHLAAVVSFARGGGETTVEVDRVTVTVPASAAAELRLPITARPPTDADVLVPLEVDGRTVAEVPGRVTHTDGASTAADDGAVVGRAALDGVYAALRAGAVTGSLR